MTLAFILDLSKVDAHFDQKLKDNPASGLVDLIEFSLSTKDIYAGFGWDGWSRIAHELE